MSNHKITYLIIRINHKELFCKLLIFLLKCLPPAKYCIIIMQKDMRSLSESEMLSTGIPKLLWLYKSKTVMGRIAELHAALEANPSEEEILDIMQELSNMNKLKVALSNHLKRLII